MTIWPQLVIIGVMVLSLISSTINHGKDVKWNAYGVFFRWVAWIVILYYGGFWNVLIK